MMRHRFLSLIFVLTCLFLSLPTRAEPWKVIRAAWGNPTPRFFASSDGRYALKVVANGPTAVAALMTLDATGAERELWRSDLPAFPVDAVIAGRSAPYVALFDAWGHAGQEHSLTIYGPTGQLVKDFKLEDLLPANDIATRVAVSPTDRWWREGAQPSILGADSPTLRLDFPWGRTLIVDLPTGRTPLISEIRDAVPLQSLALSADGLLLATGSEAPPVKLWDSTTGALRLTLDAKADDAKDLTFAAQGQVLATSRETDLILWDAATGVARPFIIKPLHQIAAVAFSPDGALVATGLSPGKFRPGDGLIEGEVKLWDVMTGAPHLTMRWKENEPPAGVAKPGDSTPSVAFSPDGTSLAGGLWRGVAVWDTATGELRRVLPTNSPVPALAYSSDGHWLAAGRQDGMVQIFDTATGSSRGTVAGFNGQGNLAFSLDGRWLAVTSQGNEIRVWDARTLKIHTVLRGHTDFVTALAFDPDSTTLYSSSEDRTVKIWRID